MTVSHGALRASDGVSLGAIRTCNICFKSKTVGGFYRHSGYVDRHYKVCYRTWNRPWGEGNPAKKKQIRRYLSRIASGPGDNPFLPDKL